MGDVSALSYGLVALCALAAGTVGGIAGYGTGLLLPLVLVPIVGAEAVVPIIGASAVFTNGSRIVAFRSEIDPRRALLVLCTALPGCILGAYGYSFLAGGGASVLIGTALVAMVPVRLAARRAGHLLSERGLAAAGAGYGLLVGGTAGSGVVLLSILMAAGLSGRAVIATDATISLVLGLVKTGTFQALGAMPPASWIMAALVGASAAPGAFVAKRLSRSLTVRAHNGILDAAVVTGGAILILQGFRAG